MQDNWVKNVDRKIFCSDLNTQDFFFFFYKIQIQAYIKVVKKKTDIT